MVPVTNDLRASGGSWDAGHLLKRAGNMLRKTQCVYYDDDNTLKYQFAILAYITDCFFLRYNNWKRATTEGCTHTCVKKTGGWRKLF